MPRCSSGQADKYTPAAPRSVLSIDIYIIIFLRKISALVLVIPACIFPKVVGHACGIITVDEEQSAYEVGFKVVKCLVANTSN